MCVSVCVCVCVCTCGCALIGSLAMPTHRANDQSGMTRLKNVKSILGDKRREEDTLDDAMERCKKLLGLLTEDDTHQRYPLPVVPATARVSFPYVMCCSSFYDWLWRGCLLLAQ